MNSEYPWIQKKTPVLVRRGFLVLRGLCLVFYNVRGLVAFGSFNDIEGDVIAFVEGLITRSLDGRVMHEDITAARLRGDKAITFFVIEPLHCTLWHTDISFLVKNQTQKQKNRNRSFLTCLRLSILFDKS